MRSAVDKNSESWDPECRVLAMADFPDDKTVHIKNIRDFSYTERGGVVNEHYYDKTFSLADIASVSYAVTPFSRIKGVAHTFVSFGFDSGEFIALSVEIRKHAGEEYSFLRSIMHPFPLMCVVATEHDLITLRALHREEVVYLYPGKASREAIGKLFVNMLRRANELHTATEYYSLFTNTCTTDLARHINELAERRLFSPRHVFLPGYTDVVAQRMGFLDVPEKLPAGREKYRINEHAVRHANKQDFSQLIRVGDTKKIS